jgi:alanine dehydrogenase
MNKIQKFQKRTDQFVVAVQINLEEAGLYYIKWGGKQMAKQGDWLVNSDGEVYTIDQDTFAKTYIPLSQDKPGCYAKTGFVWARVADKPGTVPTKEGISAFEPGDYIVANNEDGSDAYCVVAEKFREMYEAVE